MVKEDTVDISGLDKAEVLFALYEASRPMGAGFLQARDDFTIEGARELLASDENPDYPGERSSFGRRAQYFDYLFGRPLKVDLEGDEFSPWGFDRDNGGDGAAQRVIDGLRG